MTRRVDKVASDASAKQGAENGLPIDFGHIAALQRQAVEVMMASNRLGLRMVQLCMQKQMALFEDNTDCVLDGVQSFVNCQAATVENSGEEPRIADELSEILVQVRECRAAWMRTSQDGVRVVSERTVQSMDELHRMLRQTLNQIASPARSPSERAGGK